MKMKLWKYEIHIFELRNEEINVKEILSVFAWIASRRFRGSPKSYSSEQDELVQSGRVPYETTTFTLCLTLSLNLKLGLSGVNSVLCSYYSTRFFVLFCLQMTEQRKQKQRIGLLGPHSVTALTNSLTSNNFKI